MHNFNNLFRARLTLEELGSETMWGVRKKQSNETSVKDVYVDLLTTFMEEVELAGRADT